MTLSNNNLVNWQFTDLNEKMLPYIKIDYLSITCKPSSPPSSLSLENMLKQLKPNLNIIDLAEIARKKKENQEIPKEDLELYESFHQDYMESKYREQKYDLIYYNYHKKDIYAQYARIPGELSHLLLESVFSGRFELDDYDFSISRIDVKVNIPTFCYKDFDYDSDLFNSFNQIQKLERFQFNSKTGFAIGYIGNRRQRRMSRFYISKKRGVKVAEFEFKKDSAKRYAEFLHKRDVYGFNKTVVLELIEILNEIAPCTFSNPLLDWLRDYLEVVKAGEFPDESYYKRRSSTRGLKKPNKEIQVINLLAENRNVLNLNLISSFPYVNDIKSLTVMHVSFLSKKLLTKWKNQFSNFSEIKALVNEKHWNHDEVENEVFKNTDLYKIEFELQELLDYLDLSNRTESRQNIISFLDGMMNGKLEFWVNENRYSQPLIHSLKVSHRRGVPTTVSLILHPFVTYDLLNYAALFDDPFLESYYNLVAKHSLNTSKRSFTKVWTTFIELIYSFKTQDDKNLKEFLSQRNKKKPEMRKRNLNFLMEFIYMCSSYSKVNLGIKLEDTIQCPIEYNLFFSVLNKTTDKDLHNAEFFFQPFIEEKNLGQDLEKKEE